MLCRYFDIYAAAMPPDTRAAVTMMLPSATLIFRRYAIFSSYAIFAAML